MLTDVLTDKLIDELIDDLIPLPHPEKGRFVTLEKLKPSQKIEVTLHDKRRITGTFIKNHRKSVGNVVEVDCIRLEIERIWGKSRVLYEKNTVQTSIPLDKIESVFLFDEKFASIQAAGIIVGIIAITGWVTFFFPSF